MPIEVWIVLWMALSGLVGYWNSVRGHSFATAFLLSTIFSPLVGAVIVVLTRRRRRNEERSRRRRKHA